MRSNSGQTALEFLLCSLIVLPATALLLAVTFHLTGWVWSRYWAYQSLHCVFEKKANPAACLSHLRARLEFHPGYETAAAKALRLRSDTATLKWTYRLNLGVKAWTLEKTWSLKKPAPASSREMVGLF